MLRNAIIIMVNSKQYRVMQCINGIFSDKTNMEAYRMNKPVYFLIHGEEINIRKLTLPKCRLSGIPTMIDQEFSFEFNDLSNIVSCYEILNIKSKVMELIVYYFKLERIPIVKEFLAFSNHKVKGIFSSQFLILNHFRNKIKHKSYILIHKEDSILFMAVVIKRRLLKSCFIDVKKSNISPGDEINDLVKAICKEYIESGKLEVYAAVDNEHYFDECLSSDIHESCNYRKLEYKGILDMVKSQL